MAKKKEKTLEEKLQEALVPENQWPYILPENWCWTRVENVANSGKEKTTSFDSTVRYVGLENIEKDTGNIGYEFANDIKSTKSVFSKGNILYGRLRPYLNKHGKVCFDGICSTDILVFSSNDCYTAKLVDSYFNVPWFIEYAISNSKGINLPRVSENTVLDALFPLPPLLEQKRIVHRIESLFAKLDEAKEKIQQVLDGAEMRKAAILHKAFTGELTKTWRRENNITTTDDVNREKLSKECEEYDIPYEIPDEWRWVTFNEVCTFIGSGVTPKGGQAVYTDSGIPFIRSQNVLNGKLDLSDVAYISDEINEKMKRTQIIGGETLLNITGASIGRSCYVPQEQSVGNVNQHVCILRFKNYINGYIPQLWLNSPKMQEFINFNQVGQTRQALNFKQIRGIYFPLPPLQEQLEMVRIIKYEINKLDVVCNSLANLAVRIDTMKKSILAKAFRGELGTNNPTEDSALNLLKEVLQDKF